MSHKSSKYSSTQQTSHPGSTGTTSKRSNRSKLGESLGKAGKAFLNGLSNTTPYGATYVHNAASGGVHGLPMSFRGRPPGSSSAQSTRASDKYSETTQPMESRQDTEGSETRLSVDDNLGPQQHPTDFV